MDRRSFLFSLPAAASMIWHSQQPVGLPGSYDEGSGGRLPRKVVGGYWTYWGDPVRVIDVPGGYNTVFLFHATPVGGAPGTTGAVRWNSPAGPRGAAATLRADLAEFRKTRTAILTVGGADAQVDLSSRLRARSLLDSVKAIYADLGGFDGLDWNNYEGSQVPHTDQMIWVSSELRREFGDAFAFTTPPAPWRREDMRHCRRMIDAGVMDMVSPQYYGGPGLAASSYIVESVSAWVEAMGDAGKVGVGFGLDPYTDQYSTLSSVKQAWSRLEELHPRLRGAYNWNIAIDEQLSWPFVTSMSSEVVSPKPPIVPPLALPRGSGQHTVDRGAPDTGPASGW